MVPDPPLGHPTFQSPLSITHLQRFTRVYTSINTGSMYESFTSGSSPERAVSSRVPWGSHRIGSETTTSAGAVASPPTHRGVAPRTRLCRRRDTPDREGTADDVVSGSPRNPGLGSDQRVLSLDLEATCVCGETRPFRGIGPLIVEVVEPRSGSGNSRT